MKAAWGLTLPFSLLQYFMDDCKAKLLERVMERRAEVELMPQQQRIKEVVRERLELQARFCSSWPQALSIQARPHNLTHTLRQRMELGDVLWQAVGGRGSGVEMYVQKGLLGMAYQEAELFMLTDFSPGFRDTWAFLERRLEGAERMKRSALEVGLAELLRVSTWRSRVLIIPNGAGGIVLTVRILRAKITRCIL